MEQSMPARTEPHNDKMDQPTAKKKLTIVEDDQLEVKIDLKKDDNLGID